MNNDLLKEIMKCVVEEEAGKLGPNGYPITGLEIDNVAKEWASIFKKRANELGCKIKIER